LQPWPQKWKLLLTRLRLLALAAQAVLAAARYTYDSAGRLATVDYGAAGTLVYRYDNAGRLISRQRQVLSCDLYGDGATNAAGVQTIINEALGIIPAVLSGP
jgi:YD repeat-containing protein